jgi:RTX calcium-binding nonapeptide repeat (4 copies)
MPSHLPLAGTLLAGLALAGKVDVGRDGTAEFRVDRRRFHRVVILTGDGDDVVDGGPGDDLVFLGAGDDHVAWEPGDGSDLIDGGDGTDEQLAAAPIGSSSRAATAATSAPSSAARSSARSSQG